MAYTREQRLENARIASEAAARAATAAGLNRDGGSSGEPAGSVESSGGEAAPAAERAPRQPRGNPERAAALDEIEARQRSQTPGADEETPLVDEEAPAAAPKPKPAAALAPAAATGGDTPPPLPMPEAVKMVTVKVDGEQFEVPQSDVDDAGGVRAYQTMRAADNRLKKANDIVAEARRFQGQATPPAPVVPAVSDDDFIKSKMDVIRFGSTEEATAALREVMTRANPRVDENVLIAKTNANIHHDTAKGKFAVDYQDVVANPVLVRLVPDYVREELAKYVKDGQTDWQQLSALDWNKFYANIGNRIRNAVPRSSQPQPVTPATGSPSPVSPDKEARKASIVNLPTAAAARATVAEESKPESREEMLNGMRKARKQSQDG